ncbi:uncharacterized protein (TIGR02217 family) [Breoghania corrubedonensis]|uniref:Uncharacterized protein (TIGR02217 family) n=1 Tax=Breoghania corrubedonensis TaxID=665038 RepID=A0A2T5V1P5_9HYPH|nr:DUF2460 domain-containing protein [Breoghania corrubedonensis]PTW57650.1 uncharacterized protein (TIGR02217 family) [Breoghania corrubedonensis]
MATITAFHEVRFPVAVGFGSSGGPERRTDIVALGSGGEARNARWSRSRRRYDAGYGIRSFDDLAAVVAFFEERRGRLYGFRFRDPFDWKSGLPSAEPAATDCNIGTGDGETDRFRLVKIYGSGATAYVRPITKPVAGTLRIAIDGVEVASGFTLDALSGSVTFDAGSVPAEGAAITAGFAFDVPARFDTDRLEISMSHFEAGAIPQVPIVEILP